jgi:hypothetical protein
MAFRKSTLLPSITSDMLSNKIVCNAGSALSVAAVLICMHACPKPTLALLPRCCSGRTHYDMHRDDGVCLDFAHIFAVVCEGQEQSLVSPSVPDDLI